MIDLHGDRPFGWNDLLLIMRALRAPGGCPWDREQTHNSIRSNLLEESYEALEAIELNDNVLLCEELGDVLLQVVFHAQMAADAGDFTIDDVVDGICAKLVTRHPHVFGEAVVADSSEVLTQWERIKRQTKGQADHTSSLRAVPSTFPALMRASKLISRAGKAGFPLPPPDPDLTEDKLGDELWALAARARGAGVDPEQALLSRCRRFFAEFAQWETGGR